MRKILFITFDLIKEQYPHINYSIAVLIASLKAIDINSSHYSIDLQHALYEKQEKNTILQVIKMKFEENLSYFMKFEYIAISATAWSIEYCLLLLKYLSEYKGKIILGGYEVTAMNNEKLLTLFPRVDYFITGFAEKALKKIILNEYLNENKIIYEKINNEDMKSPYTSGVIQLYSRKIYWETKRGCPYRCGFCEWGNSTKEIIYIDPDRLANEIKLFQNSNIEEINILDGTFNFGNKYLEQIKKLLLIDDIKITCQARFENFDTKAGVEFIELCHKNSKRIHLELGLQTIHKKEMTAIGRRNNLNKVIKMLKIFQEKQINYEVSIIYAIPSQTVETFIDTIEFLIDKGCKNIKAFPLRIPQNSNIEIEKNKNCILEGKNELNISTVIQSYSFPVEQRKDMDLIAFRLNNGLLKTNYYKRNTQFSLGNGYKYKKATKYQWELISIDPDTSENSELIQLSIEYIAQTVSEISNKNTIEGMVALGQSITYRQDTNKMKIVSDLLSGKYQLQLRKRPIPNFDSFMNSKNRGKAEFVKPQYQSKKYICKIIISQSGNFYIYRNIIKITD